MSLTIPVEKIIKVEHSDPLLQIHSSWGRVKLSDVAEVLNGFPFKSELFNGEGKGMPLIRIRNVVDGETKSYTTETFDEQYVVNFGDLLVGMDGDFNSARWSGRDGLLNQRVCKIEVQSSSYEPRFLDFVLPGYLAAIHRHTSSVTVKHLSSKSILAIPLPLPPLAEQCRIVDALESAFADLDAGIAAIEAAQRDLDRYRRSVLKAAVEGALTADWRRQQTEAEPADALLERVLVERREQWETDQLATYKAKGKTPPQNWEQRYKQPKKLNTDDLDNLPEGWVWTSLGEAFHVYVGATPSRRRPSYWGGGIPWANSSEVGHRHITKTAESITEEGLANSPVRVHPRGTLLLGMIGQGPTRGQVARLDLEAANSQNAAAIYVSKSSINAGYVYHYLDSQYQALRRLGGGNNQQALNKAVIAEIPLPLPSLKEQAAIVEAIEERFSVATVASAELDRQRLRADRLRQAILKRAFAGELVLQDPADEPASVLLERVQKELAERKKTTTPRKRKRAMITPESTLPGSLFEIVEAEGPIEPQDLWTRSKHLWKTPEGEPSVDAFYAALKVEVIVKKRFVEQKLNDTQRIIVIA